VTKDLYNKLERYAQEARCLEGWDLDYTPEPLSPGPTWDYESRARELAAKSSAVLDLGTGGGEVLSRIVGGLGCRTVATEEWIVNAPVAERRLRNIADVVRASAHALPFAPNSFDLVLSRHEAIAPLEISCVLGFSGRCLTQQVIPDLWHELREIFPDMRQFPDHFSEYQRGFIRSGFVIEDAREFRRLVRFRDLGHLVYHLVAAPWTIPDFSVSSHFDGLEELDRQLSAGRPLVLTEGYYLLEVRRDA
jgi:SAM-dependent methyltransferase